MEIKREDIMKCQDEKNVLRCIEFLSQQEIARGKAPQLVYRRGNCGNMYSHLKSVFKCATPMTDIKCDHIGTKIGKLTYEVGGVIYNINNRTTNDEVFSCSNNYLSKNEYAIFGDLRDIFHNIKVNKRLQKFVRGRELLISQI